MKHPVVCSALLVLTALLLATCAPALSTAGPSTWIDEPLDGAKLPLEPTEIMAHASDSDGVSWFDIYVNGALLAHAKAVASAPVQLYSTGYSGAPGTAGYLASATVGWDPKKAGVYTIMAMATDSKGNPGPYTQAVVTVGTVQAAPVPSPAVPPVVEIVPKGTPSPQLPSPATSTPTPTATATNTHVPGVTTTPTHTPTRTATPTTPAPAKRAEIIYFQADPGTINAGECSSLSWDVQYAAAVYLDGQGVTAPNTQQVCPATTTTYTLYAQSAGGDAQATATVTVIEAQAPTHTPTSTPIVDTTAPDISGLDADPDSITANVSPCTGQTTTISVNVYDVSGVANVVVYWTLGPQNGQANMAPQGGVLYQTVLGPFYDTGNLLITVVAWDTIGNSTPTLGPITVVVHTIC